MPHKEWLDIDDPDPEKEGWQFRFDVTFLMSGWHCTFGQGCPGTYGNAEVGCCSDGVYLSQDADDELGAADLKKLEARVAKMTEDDWQFKPVAEKKGWKKTREKDAWHTRLHKGACIFANRQSFADAHGGEGMGCAFHYAALRRGENPLDWKPNTCWQVPIQYLEDEDEYVTTIRPYENYEDWGFGDWEPLDWWTVDDPRNYGGQQPVYRYMEEELRRLVGNEVYEELAAYLDERMARRPIGRTPVNWEGRTGMKSPNGTTGIPLPMHP